MATTVDFELYDDGKPGPGFSWPSTCKGHEPWLNFVQTSSPPRLLCKHCGGSMSVVDWWDLGFLRDWDGWSAGKQAEYKRPKGVTGYQLGDPRKTPLNTPPPDIFATMDRVTNAFSRSSLPPAGKHGPNCCVECGVDVGTSRVGYFSPDMGFLCCGCHAQMTAAGCLFRSLPLKR